MAEKDIAVLMAQCAAQLMPYVVRSSPYPVPFDDEAREAAAREAVLMALAIFDEVDKHMEERDGWAITRMTTN